MCSSEYQRVEPNLQYLWDLPQVSIGTSFKQVFETEELSNQSTIDICSVSGWNKTHTTLVQQMSVLYGRNRVSEALQTLLLGKWDSQEDTPDYHLLHFLSRNQALSPQGHLKWVSFNSWKTAPSTSNLASIYLKEGSPFKGTFCKNKQRRTHLW